MEFCASNQRKRMFERSSKNGKRKLIVSGVKSENLLENPIPECVSTVSPSDSVKNLIILKSLNVFFKENCNRQSRDVFQAIVREISINRRHQRKQGKRKRNQSTFKKLSNSYRLKPHHVFQRYPQSYQNLLHRMGMSKRSPLGTSPVRTGKSLDREETLLRTLGWKRLSLDTSSA